MTTTDQFDKRSMIAVVVTYNRLDKLKNTLIHISEQSEPIDRVVVVDNASNDGTPEFLLELAQQNEKIAPLLLDVNVGGAGGFSRGIKQACKLGCDFVWIMDDDSYPTNDALEKLVSCYSQFNKETTYVPGFACSLVKWYDDICEMNIPETVWDWPRHICSGFQNVALVKHCSFVSVLIPRAKIEKFGLPLSDFFIWFDDVEYTKRLSADYPGLFVMDSIVHHDLPENKGVSFALVNDTNLWKYKYGARNQSYFHYNRDKIQWLSFVFATVTAMKRNKVSRRCRNEIYRSIFSGVFMKIKVEYL